VLEEEKEPSDRSTRSGIGHLCDYCNIKQGWSVIFNSFDEYVNHVIKNHPGQKVCHNGTTDLNSFAEKSRIEWEQVLARHQREYLKYLFGPAFVGLAPLLEQSLSLSLLLLHDMR
jgi:hypothetical protein